MPVQTGRLSIKGREKMKKSVSLISVLLICVMMLSALAGCKSRGAVNDDKASPVDIKVAAMKGPTAIGMVKLMQDAKDGKTFNNYDFQIAAAADEFTSLLVKGDIQIAAVPCNAASALYNKSNGKIKVLGINTLGVLYILENGNTVKDLSDIKGKTIYSTGKGTTPEYTLRYLLAKAGIDPDKDVTIEYKSEASEVAAIMKKEGNGTIAMLPQPYVTTVMLSDDDIRIAFDVTQEWERLTSDGSTIVTGVIAVNADFYESNKSAVDMFMKEYQQSVEYVNANIDDAAKLVEEFNIFKADVAREAIPYCNITFIKGSEAAGKIDKYLSVLNEQNPQSVGGKMPDDGFYVK